MRNEVVYPWILVAALLQIVWIRWLPPWLVPLAGATVVFPVYLAGLLAGEIRQTVWRMLGWALLVSVVTVLATTWWPEAVQRHVWRGASYRDEMFHWIRTGVGPESTPSQFFPQHVLHYAVFMTASLLTLGWAGLAMGCALLNYMNFYVGSLVLEAEQPILAALLGWPPYAVIRVVAYVLGATAVTALVLRRLGAGSREGRGRIRRLLGWSVALFAVDILLKMLVAGSWGSLLRRILPA
jgi:hypothetical protein